MSVSSEETYPLAGLPPADRSLLADPPLELAIIEIRFEAAVTAVPVEVALQAQALLTQKGRTFAGLTPAHENRVEIALSPTGDQPRPQSHQLSQGWQLLATDGSAQITVMPRAVVIQTTRYERWSVTLKPVLELLLATVQTGLAPGAVTRIGLRYVDRFVDPQAISPQAWSGRIHEALFGAVTHPVFAPHVRSALQQLELALGDAQGALVRHGPFVDQSVDNSVSYLVDIDVFDAKPSAFNVPDLIRRAEILNRTAASLFQQTMTADYLHTLQEHSTHEKVTA